MLAAAMCECVLLARFRGRRRIGPLLCTLPPCLHGAGVQGA